MAVVVTLCRMRVGLLAIALLVACPASSTAQLAPAIPVLPPAKLLTPVDWPITRPVCTKQPCPPNPSHWYLYRNNRYVRKQETTFAAPPGGDVFYRVERTTATRSIGIAPANENFNPKMPYVGPVMTTVLQATVVQNPTLVTFLCPDHAQDTGHEIDIVSTVDNKVVQTINGGDPAADSQGMVSIKLNVQPITFGTYITRVRAIFGSVKSVNSPDSDVWERSPGPPSKPTMQ